MDPCPGLVQRACLAIGTVFLTEQATDTGEPVLKGSDNGKQRDFVGRPVEAKSTRPSSLRGHQIGGRQAAEDLGQELRRQTELVGDFGGMESAVPLAKGEKGEGADRVFCTARQHREGY